MEKAIREIIPANEVIVLVSFELTVGEMRGMMNLCIPFNSIERVSGKLSSNNWVSYAKKPATAESIEAYISPVISLTR